MGIALRNKLIQLLLDWLNQMPAIAFIPAQFVCLNSPA